MRTINTVQDRKGSDGNVTHGGTVIAPRNRKGGAANPPPTDARAIDLPDSLSAERALTSTSRSFPPEHGTDVTYMMEPEEQNQDDGKQYRPDDLVAVYGLPSLVPRMTDALSILSSIADPRPLARVLFPTRPSLSILIR